jgi:capsular polysaccharide export protein
MNVQKTKGRYYYNKLRIRNWFQSRKRSIFLKNVSKHHSNDYPYTIHNPSLIISSIFSIKKTILVGDNWLDKKNQKPIAIMLYFNKWKYGFTADYLHEYRVIFLPMKISSVTLYFMIIRMIIRPSLFIVWGYKESRLIRFCSRALKIPIHRMEDGFVRSSLLGASHAVPYSLVIDKKGLYYDMRGASDLEDILNKFNFKSDNGLLISAKKSLNMLLDYGLSKYNLPTTSNEKKLYVQGKKQVAVLGQVNKDMAMKYGNPNKWTSEEIVELARMENPDADIYFRPHPEVYKGYQKNKFKTNRIKYTAEVVPPDQPIVEFLEHIDHVYVVNSLSGLDALIRGKKVTVLGYAFYAGWGLTDDRLTYKRRNRVLTLEELFAGVFLKYPRYLADLDNSFVGLCAACNKIKADQYIATFDAFEDTSSIFVSTGNKFFSDVFKKKSREFKDKIFNHSVVKAISEIAPYIFKEKRQRPLLTIAASEFWPQALINNIELTASEELSVVEAIRIDKLFNKNTGVYFEIAILYFVAGTVNFNKSRDKFIERVREHVNSEVLNSFLIDLMEYYPGPYVYKHLNWLFSENNLGDDAISLSEEYLNEVNYLSNDDTSMSTNGEKIFINVNTEKDKRKKEETPEEEKIIAAKEKVEVLYKLLDSYRDNYDYKGVIEIAKKLLLINNFNSIIFVRLANAASLSGDIESAGSLGRLIKVTNLYGHNRAGIHIEVESFNFDSSKKSSQYITQLFALELALNPDRINRNWARLKTYFSSNEHWELFSAMLNLYGKRDMHKVVSYIERGYPEKALHTIELLIEDGNKSDKIFVRYAEILSSLGKHSEAEEILLKLIDNRATHTNYTEYLRLLRATAQFDKAIRVVNEALDKSIDLTYEGHIMPIYFGAKMIEEGFKCFTESDSMLKLIKLFGNDKYRKEHHFRNFNNVLLIFNSGPSEEMRFASMYREIHNSIGHDNYKMTCDHRLHGLFSRSFPEINFIPVERSRFFTKECPPTLYNKLPSTDTCNFLDNKTLDHVMNADQIKLTTELLHNFRKKYSDFRGKDPHLIVDNNRVDFFRKKLPEDVFLVGLSWRSSLTNATRNIHYLTIDDLIPVFDIPNIVFVNLQYDECSHELRAIRKKYNKTIIDFPDLDQMNDFDGVASLMKCLDVVVSPLTAVIELAGSIGTSGLLFSNHGETHWRKVDEKKSDVWYDSVRIIDNGVCGDKKSLVDGIKKELIKRYDNKHSVQGLK